MKKTWRETTEQLPNDSYIALVSTYGGDKTLARYFDDEGWIDEFNNRWLEVKYWMPIPITPDE